MSSISLDGMALEKKLIENEGRSRQFKVFIAQAQARLNALRSDRMAKQVEPQQPPDPAPPAPEVVTPLQPKDLPPAPPRTSSEDSAPPLVPRETRETKGYYLQAFGGYLIPETVKMKSTLGPKFDIESDDGFSSGIVFGRDFGRFRLESEFSGRRYNHSTLDLSSLGPAFSSKTPVTGHSTAFGGLINAILDIQLTKKLGVFIGAGTGVNGANIKLLNSSYKDTLFAYQLLTGFALDLAERVSARFTYKYFTTAGSKDFDRLGSHNLELGIQVDL